MSRRGNRVVSALGALLVGAGAARAAEPGPPPESAAAKIGDSLPLGGTVTDPDWVQRPSGDDLAELYPKLAQIMNLAGRTIMDCGVTAAGQMDACKITSEAPLGVGFGDATLRAATRFQMKPMTLDGAPVAGARVQIPMRWVLQDDAPSSPAPAEPAVPAARLPLARRVAELAGAAQIVTKSIDASLRNIVDQQNQDGAVTHPAEREFAVEAVRGAAAAVSARTIEIIARSYATHLDEAQLQQVAAFLASPTGRAWSTLRNPVSQQESRSLYKLMGQQARVRFCAKVRCLEGAAPPVAKGQP